MKKVNKFAAAMAVALSIGSVPLVQAQEGETSDEAVTVTPTSSTTDKMTQIEFHPSGRGDALLFPAYNGYIENYFTVMNNHSAWIQGHIRFRGAAWSGEIRDFDIMLSPGDVFVFRLADVDGDGEWEIDQSLDHKNFRYTGLGDFTCGPPDDDMPGVTRSKCMDISTDLIPSASELAAVASMDVEDAQGIIDYHTHMGYVEFIGEAVLDGMTGEIMEVLLSDVPGVWSRHQTKVFSRRGTNAWVWSDAVRMSPPGSAENAERHGRGLSDVPNALSGTAFISIPGISHGLAYNAEALVNFRTANSFHRIDNYSRDMLSPGAHAPEAPSSLGGDNAVILHHENGATPDGNYIYRFDDSRVDEARISFNNTWGPTLADGDDYDLVNVRPVSSIIPEFDDWDEDLDENNINSIAEVEEAIRLGVAKHQPEKAASQLFTAYYFDGDLFDKSCEGNGTRYPHNMDFCPTFRNKPDGVTRSTLVSHYFAFFPTKFYYGEDDLFYGKSNFDDYFITAISQLLALQKPVYLEVWDIFENHIGRTGPSGRDCISPAIGPECTLPTEGINAFGFELTFVSIKDIKNMLGSSDDDFLSGRVVIEFPQQYNTPMGSYRHLSWPGLMYTFEWDKAASLSHWRPMHRMHPVTMP